MSGWPISGVSGVQVATLDARGRQAAGARMLDRLAAGRATVSISATSVDRQPHAEFALDAQHQLGAAERVDAEIAVEAARERHVAALQALRRKLAHQFAHDRDQLKLA